MADTPTSAAAVPTTLPADPSLPAHTLAKISRRLIPLLIGLYLLNYLDRTNVAIAKLQMIADLGFGKDAESIYAFGASAFFIAYFLFEVPSNLILARVGARRWIARIMITWGIISASMMFIAGPRSFYALRFLLGAAEAGFLPGIIFYLAFWIPAQHRARAIAWFLTSTALAGVIGGPLGGALLQLDSFASLRGWQWIFLLEGIPSILCGILVYFFLLDGPARARFLSPAEKSWLTAELQRERHDSPFHHRSDLRHAFTAPVVWLLSAIYIAIIAGFQCLSLWMPTIFKLVYLQNHPHPPTDSAADAHADLIASCLIAIPYAAACIAMILFARSSDRSGDRRRPVALASLAAAAGLALAALALYCQSLPGLVAAFTLATAGVWATLGPFWSLPSLFLHGTAAAAAIAIINSMANLGGGFLGPNIIGALQKHYDSFIPGLLITAAITALAVPLVLLLRQPRQPG